MAKKIRYHQIGGGTADQFIKADGSIDEESYWSTTTLKYPITKNANEDIWSTKTFTNGVPFVFKMSGSKSWIWHKPTFNSLIFAPSLSVFGTDWDWSKQIELKDNGTVKANSFEIVGKDDTSVVLAGGGTAKADNFRDLLEQYSVDVEIVPNRTYQTTNVVVTDALTCEVIFGDPADNIGHTIHVIKKDNGGSLDVNGFITGISVRYKISYLSDGNDWIEIGQGAI